MTVIASRGGNEAGRRFALLLTSPRVTGAFRDVLLKAASAADMTPGEFALVAAAEKLRAAGAALQGVFHPGDLDLNSVNRKAPTRLTQADPEANA